MYPTFIIIYIYNSRNLIGRLDFFYLFFSYKIYNSRNLIGRLDDVILPSSN